jgi:hypothetical protein
VATSEDTVRVRALNGPATLAALMREADARLQRVRLLIDDRLDAAERLEFEEAAQHLRAAIRCVDP